MKIGTLLLVNAFVAMPFGIAFTFAPAETAAPYGVQLPVAGLLLARLFGASLIGFGIVSWLLRTADAGPQRAAAISIAVADAIGTTIAIWGVVSATLNSVGSSAVAIYGLIFGAFAMHLIRRPVAARPSQLKEP